MKEGTYVKDYMLPPEAGGDLKGHMVACNLEQLKYLHAHVSIERNNCQPDTMLTALRRTGVGDNDEQAQYQASVKNACSEPCFQQAHMTQCFAFCTNSCSLQAK